MADELRSPLFPERSYNGRPDPHNGDASSLDFYFPLDRLDWAAGSEVPGHQKKLAQWATERLRGLGGAGNCEKSFPVSKTSAPGRRRRRQYRGVESVQQEGDSP